MIRIFFFISILYISNIHAIDMGQTLWQGNCVTCHNPTKAISAPSANEIRLRYLDAFPHRKDFVEYMSVWVSDPQEETSIMGDAIEKYNLMPQLAYPLSTTQEIAEYIYKTDFNNN